MEIPKKGLPTNCIICGDKLKQGDGDMCYGCMKDVWKKQK